MACLLPLNQNVNVMNSKIKVVNANDVKDVKTIQMPNDF
jgi:hypothetical protein